jgi:hypothetical protein
MIPTIKVKPWGKDQGDHVLINEADFDPKVHARLDGKAPAKAEAPAKADPFDHDGDGKPGGSLKGAQSTRAKGAAKRRKGK